MTPRIHAALLAALAVARPAERVLAQGGVSGRIVGSVVDQAGAPIEGVQITVRSNTQIGGAKTATTSREGFFRIVSLLPGAFEVTAVAAGLKTVLQKGVKVGVVAAAEVHLVMEVETRIEEVKVSDKAPVVSTTTANVREVYDEEFVDALPVEWKTAIEDFVGNNTPGVYYNARRTIRVRGGGLLQNAFNLEGFTMNDQRLTSKSLAALEVQTAAYGADNAYVPGGVVNMVSKSGSNRYELDVSGFVEDSNLVLFRDATDRDVHSWNIFLNPAVSGPIIKDRLWFYFNAESRNQVDPVEGDPSGMNILGEPATVSFLDVRGLLKLTWQATPRNKLSTYSSVNRDVLKNFGMTGRDERSALLRRDNLDFFHGIIWEALLSGNVFLRSQIGYNQFWLNQGPALCGTEPDVCDHIPQVRNIFPRDLWLGNADMRQQRVARSWEVINQIEWFLGPSALGQHEIRLRSRIFHELWEEAQSTPGDSYSVYSGGAPLLRRVYFTNDPRREPERFGWRIHGSSGLTTVHSLTDSVRLGRHLTVSPGFALTTVRAANVGQEANLAGVAVTPHVQVAWDATRDGRTVLRGSFNQYVDTDAVRLARFAAGERVYKECGWNPGTQEFDAGCRFGGGALQRTFGLPCGPSGVDAQGVSCRERLRVPRTWEYTAGAEREIVPGIALGGDLVYRLYTYPYENRETNRLWSPSGQTLDPLGSTRNGLPETVLDLGTPGTARRRYIGVTATLHKREGALKANIGYTWAMLEGNVNDIESNDFGTNPARDQYLYGYLQDDSRHTIKAALTYLVRPWLSTGVLYRYISGRPYQRRFRNDVEGGFVDYRAPVGIDPGANINDPGDDRALRLPDVQHLNLQLRANLKPLLGVGIEGFVDVINILALRTTVSVTATDGPAWGTPVSRLGPLRMRLGFRWRY